jgi:hypothetical protein
MDQTTDLRERNRRLATERLSDFIVASVDAAAASDVPFYRLVLDRVFPDDIYAAMLAQMPHRSIGQCMAAARAMISPMAPTRE